MGVGAKSAETKIHLEKIMTTRLNWTTTTSPDFGGFRFYIEEGRLFDAGAQDVHSVQDAAGRLSPGEWLEVSHETD